MPTSDYLTQIEPNISSTLKLSEDLILKAWAKATWDFGKKEAYFSRFMGHGSGNVIQVYEDLSRGKGTSIEIPLILPLEGAGVIEDEQLEEHEEKMHYRSCTVYLGRVRNAVRLKGRFEEQKVKLNMRSDMRKLLSQWLGRYIDLSLFSIFTGVNPPFKTASTQLPYTVEAPSMNRIVVPDGVTVGNTLAATENAITAAKVFNADLIGKARRLAQANELRAVQPIRIDGRETYVMVIDPYQARDLRKDTKWLEAQKHANIRGEKNPIFSGAMGIYEGVVIHEHLRVPRTTNSNSVKVGHALFLGAQAAIFAEGSAPRWDEETFDYGNQYGVSIDRMFGLKKSQFTYETTDTSPTDFGVINVLTSSSDD